MAPTEVLAEQHLRTLERLLERRSASSVRLLTGDVPTRERDAPTPARSRPASRVVVGTHALIQDDVEFRAAAAGGDRRAAPVRRQPARRARRRRDRPHLLVMTATPIPRTLALTSTATSTSRSSTSCRRAGSRSTPGVLGEPTRASVLRRSPSRSPRAGRRTSSARWWRNPRSGRGARPPRPRPSGSRGRCRSSRRAAARPDEGRRREGRGDARVRGRRARRAGGDDRDRGRRGRAERDGDGDRGRRAFGLSQLHQLRGRVGRGAEQSYCFLFESTRADRGRRARGCRRWCEHASGFELAEIDLEHARRGPPARPAAERPPDFRHARLPRDRELLEQAGRDAAELLAPAREPLTSEEAADERFGGP